MFNFSLCAQLRVHQFLLTNLCYSHECDYLLTTSQDCLLKLVKINKTYLEGTSEFSTSSISSSTTSYFNEKAMFLIYELNSTSTDPNNSLTPITSMCIYNDNTLNDLSGASGYQDGTIRVWNFLNGSCKHKLRCSEHKSIIKLEIVDSLLVSLGIDHQMCIWNRVTGELVKELQFIAPFFTRPPTNLSAELDSQLQLKSSNFGLIPAVVLIVSSFIRTVSRKNSLRKTSGAAQTTSALRYSRQHGEFHIAPTMCLYSRNILATGGCACIFFWDIRNGELVKKVNINKSNLIPRQRAANARASYVKNIQVVKQKESSTSKSSKLLLVSDYTDSICVLKIPANII